MKRERIPNTENYQYEMSIITDDNEDYRIEVFAYHLSDTGEIDAEYAYDIEYIDPLLGTETNKSESLMRPNQSIGVRKRVGGTNKIRRSGSTITKKGYCSSSSQYLKSRCKTTNKTNNGERCRR